MLTGPPDPLAARLAALAARGSPGGPGGPLGGLGGPWRPVSAAVQHCGRASLSPVPLPQGLGMQPGMSNLGHATRDVQLGACSLGCPTWGMQPGMPNLGHAAWDAQLGACSLGCPTWGMPPPGAPHGAWDAQSFDLPGGARLRRAAARRAPGAPCFGECVWSVIGV
eukprot:gene16537-biopygen5912